MTPAPSPSPPKNARSSVFARVAAACAVVLLAILAAAGPATASTWTMRQLAPIRNSENEPVQIGLSGISCPSESLCVAVGGREGTIAVSQNPTGGSASWDEVKLEYPVGPGKTCVEGEPDCEPPSGALQAVSCASESFCALTTYDGWIFVSTDPTGGADTWLPVNVNGKSQKGATHADLDLLPIAVLLCRGFGRVEQRQRRPGPDLDEPGRGTVADDATRLPARSPQYLLRHPVALRRRRPRGAALLVDRPDRRCRGLASRRNAGGCGRP